MTDELFSRTFLPLQESLYRVAYHLLRSEQAAEDAVQELYLKLWRGRESLGIVNNPKAYCITVLRNLCLDIIRRNARTDAGPVSVEGPPDEFSQEDSLDARQRQEDLSYEEISKETGINQLMLRVLMSNARKKIKNSIRI